MIKPPSNKNPNDATGFVSPTQDYLETRLSIDDYVIKNPNATYFGIIKQTNDDVFELHCGDVLVIERSRRPMHDNLVLVFAEGEFRMKKLRIIIDRVYLAPLGAGKVIDITGQEDTVIHGVVTYIIQKAENFCNVLR